MEFDVSFLFCAVSINQVTLLQTYHY